MFTSDEYNTPLTNLHVSSIFKRCNTVRQTGAIFSNCHSKRTFHFPVVRSLHAKMEEHFGQPAFNILYRKSMQEYISLGYMSPSLEFLLTLEDRKSFFLPHHGVLKVIDAKESSK